MKEKLEELNKFNPQALIEEINSVLITSPDAEGNKIFTFKEFISSILQEKSIDVKNLNEDQINKIKDIYHTVIYSRPVPLKGNPFDQYQGILENLLNEAIEKEKNPDLTGFTIDLEGGAKFKPSTGEFYDPENKNMESIARTKELNKYLQFRKDNNF